MSHYRFLASFGFLISIHGAGLTAPPEFIPPKLIKNLPKPAAIIQHEVTELLSDNEKGVVAFDVHGIFSKELQPSTDGHLTLSNRFIPTLEFTARRATVLAVSAHDKPDVLYDELRSLKYGPKKHQNLFSAFVGKLEKPQPQSGIIVFPTADKGFQIVKYAKFGNVLSVSVPGTVYFREKVLATLLSYLEEREIASLIVPIGLYNEVHTRMQEAAGEIAQIIAVKAGQYYPAGCVSWNLIPATSEFLTENWHRGDNRDALFTQLNVFIEKEICGRIQKGKRVYPYGKPSQEQKQALIAGMDDIVAKWLEERKRILQAVEPQSLDAVVTKLTNATKKSRLFFIEDSFENLTAFQSTVIKSGYFQDSKIYLQYAQTPEKDKELSAELLMKQLNPLDKSTEELKDSN